MKFWLTILALVASSGIAVSIFATIGQNYIPFGSLGFGDEYQPPDLATVKGQAISRAETGSTTLRLKLGLY